MIWLSTFQELGRPLIVAHGGASSFEPDNTMAAFRAAMTHADALEMDIRLTSDDVPICLHDDLIPLRDGAAISINQITWQDLRRLRPMTPTLAEACDLESAIFLDIKERDPDRFVKAVAISEVVANQSRFIVGAPTIDASRALADVYPAMHQIALMSDQREIDGFARARDDRWVRLHEPNANRLRLAEFRERGVRVIVTCGCGDRPVGDCNPQSLHKIFSMSPDAIVVNDPALARRAAMQIGDAV